MAKRVSTQLTDYGRMDAFMDRLMQYEGVDIKLYNSEAGPGLPAEV